MIQVLLVTPENTLRLARVEPGKLADFEDLLDGASPECLLAPAFGAYVAEEGKLDGLAMNLTATLTARQMQWANRDDALVGPVVFFGGFDADGYELPVPDPLIRTCVNIHGRIHAVQGQPEGT